MIDWGLKVFRLILNFRIWLIGKCSDICVKIYFIWIIEVVFFYVLLFFVSIVVISGIGWGGLSYKSCDINYFEECMGG